MPAGFRVSPRRTPEKRSMRALPLASWIACAALVPSLAAAAPADSTNTDAIGVSPMLVAAAGDVWSVIARPDNPVWPEWNASDTPLLLYLPNRQELLIHHPKPPEGFQDYRGPLTFPNGGIKVR